MKKEFVVISCVMLLMASCGTFSQTTAMESRVNFAAPVFIPKSTDIPTPTEAPPAPTQEKEEYTYLVMPGDTLYSIAQSHNLDWQILALINGVEHPELIMSGTILRLPRPAVVPTSTIPGKEIVVVIAHQKVYAFENGILVNTFVVSTGKPETPTVLGNFRIELMYELTTMEDEAKTYHHENVPWTMYFGNEQVSVHEGYGLHGTDWHENFGTPMSHGCVNLRKEDADWLYHWAELGTPVTIINE